MAGYASSGGIGCPWVAVENLYFVRLVIGVEIWHMKGRRAIVLEADAIIIAYSG